MATTKKKRETREKRVVSAARRLAEHTTGSAAIKAPDGVKFFQPKKGAYTIDIVPFTVSGRIKKYKKPFAEPGDLYYEQTYYVHYGIGPDKDAVVCLARTFGQPCPVCEHRNELSQDPKTPDKAIQALATKERQLFYVYDREEPRSGLQLWEIAFWNFGKQLDAKIQNASPKKRELYENFASLENGATLRIVGTEEPMEGGKPYLKYGVDEMMEREEPIPEKIVEQAQLAANALDRVPVAMTYDQLRKLFLFGGAEDDVKGKKTSKAERNGDDEEEEEEETEEEEEADEPEEEEEADETEEEETEEAELSVGDTVRFKYKGKTKEGSVVKINEKKNIAEIEIEGQEKPSVVNLDELTIVSDDSEEEEETEEETEEEETEEEETDEWDAGEEEEAEEEEAEEEEPKPKKKPIKKPGKK
jgi:hypothetical protein